jgi:AcrR family transcriptional regulator
MGRPRSQRATAAILDATLDLLRQRGLRDLSVDAIASHAGVSKATIYRWWPGKAAVVMDAFLAGTGPRMPFPDSGSTREDLRRQLRSVIRLFNEPATRRPFVALIAESQHDPELAGALRERFIASRRAAAREVFARGVARGELRADLDPELLVDMIVGPVVYRSLIGGRFGPDHLERLADGLIDGLRRR